METEILNIKSPYLKENSIPNDSLLVFDLQILIEKMKHSDNSSNGGLNSMILMKRPDKQIVLTSFREEIKIKSFQANDSITFQIVQGKLKCHTKNESVILEEGQSLVIHDNIKYSLTTREKTVFLSTITSGKFHS